MIREVILDTETTGLDPLQGHRIVEVGAIELVNHVPTGEFFHRHINPMREVSKEAEAVHGLTTAFLGDKPPFADVVSDFLSFIGESRLVIHNAPFDLGFLNAELFRCGASVLTEDRVVDTLRLARQRHPMGPNSLDALCRRYGVDNSRRRFHGALLDAELLADVYLELIGGRQVSLELSSSSPGRKAGELAPKAATKVRPRKLAARLSEDERAAHAAMIAEMGGNPLWSRE
jgi:DNA polymerase-3 subunit epsilon